MKRFFLLLSALIVPLLLSAQTRLYTSSGMWISRSQEHQLILNTVFDSDYLGYSGFTDFGRSSVTGFYLDEKAGSVIYTAFGITFDSIVIDGEIYSRPSLASDKYKRLVLNLSRDNVKYLSELLYLAVNTSSPQNDYSGCDGTTYFFASACNIAECWSPEPPSCQADLVDVCRTVCKACEAGDEHLIDAQKEKIKELTAIYKNLLNYDFNYYPSERFMTIGSLDSYVYVAANFDTEIDESNLPAHKTLLEKIARFLVENTDGHVNCNISVRSSMKEKDYHVTDVEDIIIGPEGFTQEKLMPVFHKILKRIY